MSTIEPIASFKGKKRRTLMDIPRTVGPDEVWNTVMASPGWPYIKERESMVLRDRAYVFLLYLGALRCSEALRILKKQFRFDGARKTWTIEGVKLSKEKTGRRVRDPATGLFRVDPALVSEANPEGFARKSVPRKHAFREEVWLPLKGERARFTELIIEHAKTVEPEARLFPFGIKRARQIVPALTGGTWDDSKRQFTGGLWSHYFRAQGERYLYRKWGRDLAKTAEYVKVEEATLRRYLGSEDVSDLPAV